MHAGDFDRGRLLLDRAIALRTNTEGPDDHGTLRAHTTLGRLEYTRGDYAAAGRALRHALDGFTRIGADDHPFVVEAKTWLGRTLIAGGDSPAGIALLQEARALGETQLPVNHVDNVVRRAWLGEALVAAGNTSEGQLLLEKARSDLELIRRNWQAALAADPVPSLNALLDTPGA